MKGINRKTFLRQSAAVAAAGWLMPGLFWKPGSPPLAFSTLGCPGWDMKKITAFAVAHGFSGLELRGLLQDVNLTLRPEFTTERPATMKMMREHQLHFADLGSSATMHFDEGPEREKNLAEGKAYIDLAQQLECPNVRVFPNLLPKERSREQTFKLIADGLRQLGDYARSRGVRVLMETHGDLVWTADLVTVMEQAAHPQVGVVWDPCNMWTATKEPVDKMYQSLKTYIHHTHIKDAKLVDGKPQYTRMGQGEVPIWEAIDALRRGGYQGYYSFEWEKRWHPELEEPESVFADYASVMKKHFERN